MDHAQAGPGGGKMRPPTEPPPPLPPRERGQTSTALEVLQVRKGAAGLEHPRCRCRGAAAFGSRSSVWCVLEAELVALLAGAVLRVGDLEPLAPHDTAGKGEVCLVPFGDQLLQIAGAL
jgi:hypothetical protein